MRVFKNTNYDFVGKRHLAFVASGAAVVLSIVLMFTRGMNFGVDFAGGTELQLKFQRHVEAEVLRETLRELGFEKASVQVFGEPEQNEYLVRVERKSLLDQAQFDSLVESLKTTLGKAVTVAPLEESAETGITVAPFDEDQGDTVELVSTEALDVEAVKAAATEVGIQVKEVREYQRGDIRQYTIRIEGLSTRLAQQLLEKLGPEAVDSDTLLRRVEYVGSQVGHELRTRGFLSLLYACGFILLYLAIRFDFRFAPGAVVALAHDAFLTVGLYSLTGLEFNLTSIAAILTVIGYSVNDTVVIYDRVRENLDRYPGRALPTVINQSVNETLSRTLMTSLTTLLALVGLWVMAQGTIRDFAIAMSFGIVVGTYSTVFVASPMVVWLEGLIGKSARKGAKGGSGGAAKKAA